MKSLKYIWRNVTRNKLRTSLTILVGRLQPGADDRAARLHGDADGRGAREAKKHNRIVVHEHPGLLRDSCRSPPSTPCARSTASRRPSPMPGTAAITRTNACRLPQFATDADQVFKVWDEFEIDPAQLQAVAERPAGLRRRSPAGGKARLENRRSHSHQGNVLPVRSRPETVAACSTRHNTPIRCGSTGSTWTRGCSK